MYDEMGVIDLFGEVLAVTPADRQRNPRCVYREENKPICVIGRILDVATLGHLVSDDDNQLQSIATRIRVGDGAQYGRFMEHFTPEAFDLMAKIQVGADSRSGKEDGYSYPEWVDCLASALTYKPDWRDS